MDVLRKVENPPIWRRKWMAVVPLFGLVAILFGVNGFSNADFVADRGRVNVAEVLQGEFFVQVRGVGIVTPKHNQVIIANVEGHVERIEKEAGAEVKQGDALVRIANPKLHEQLSEMQWELEAVKKENHASAVALRTELSDLRAEVKKAESSYELAKMKVDAERGLSEKGIVSRINFEQTKLAADQQKDLVASSKERVRMMEERLKAMLDAHDARARKMNNSLNLIKQQVEDLVVRAPIDGVVQQVTIKLGQAVTKGMDIGRIAPYDNLVAILDIQDYQASDVRVGQIVHIDARGTPLKGQVVRVEPTVANGVVKTEVELSGPLPADLRANQSVEGVIDIERRQSAIYVTRPPLARGHSRAAVFKVDGDNAVRTPVEFGLVSTRHIEVLSGLKPGDHIVVSDTASWEKHDRVYIK